MSFPFSPCSSPIAGECSLNSINHIYSKSDLFVRDAVTQQLVYQPCTELLYNDFRDMVHHLHRNLVHASEELVYAIEKHITDSLLLVYENLNFVLDQFITRIRALYKSMYVSLYRNYNDEVNHLYTDILKSDIVHFLTLTDQRNLASLTLIKQQLCLVDQAFLEISQINVIRTSDEMGVILVFLSEDYTETHGSIDDELYPSFRNAYFSQRFIPLNSSGLRHLLCDTLQDMRNTKLGHAWSVNQCASNAILAYELFKAQCDANDFADFFRNQAYAKRLQADLQKRIEWESTDHPLFLSWVDPERLHDYLWSWINVNITRQQEWYVVWSVMKYSMKMIRPNVTLQTFADYMIFMFPQAKVKCIYNSIVRPAARDDHEKHVSAWKKCDPDLKLATDLYQKLMQKHFFSANLS